MKAPTKVSTTSKEAGVNRGVLPGRVQVVFGGSGRCAPVLGASTS